MSGFDVLGFDEAGFDAAVDGTAPCGFDSSGFDTAGFDSCGGVDGRRYPGPAGAPSKRGRQKRKKYVLEGQTLALTRDELEDALEALLTRQAAQEAPTLPARVKAKDAAIVAAFPAYPELRDMLLAAQQIEAAQALRAVAQRLADDEDERDVEMLLLWG